MFPMVADPRRIFQGLIRTVRCGVEPAGRAGWGGGLERGAARSVGPTVRAAFGEGRRMAARRDAAGSVRPWPGY